MAHTTPFRTPDELKNIELNYFIAFKVELGETDKTKIEAQIKRVLSDPKGGVFARRLLELKADAFEIMCNDAIYDSSTSTYIPGKGGRAKEAKAAKEFKLSESVSFVEMLCQTRKTLLKSEIVSICDAANKPVVYFTSEEFEARLSYLTTPEMGVKIIDNIDNSIPFADYQQAEKHLKALDNTDLYDFLGLPKAATKDEIEKKSDEIYKLSTKTNDLKKKQSISTLCGTVKKLLLKTPDARNSYDCYLALKEDVWDQFEDRRSRGFKEMHMDEYRDYVQKIISILGVRIDEAEKMLAVGCKYFQITIVGKMEDNNFEFCPYDECGKLYIRGAKSCPHCGKPLEIICWNCRSQTPFTKEDKGCESCGATYHAHEMFLKKCENMDAVLSQPTIDIAKLRSALLEIKNIVPDYSSCSDSTIAKKVKEYEGSVQIKVREEETLGGKYREEIKIIQDLMIRKSYQTALGKAKSLLTKFSTYNVANTNKLISDIAAVTNKADEQAAQAKRYMAQGNESAAVIAAAKAIDISSDHSEARMIMQKYPPKPATSVSTTIKNGVVKIEWTDNLKQDFITYTVIKKVGLPPISYDDGAVVEKGLTLKFVEDSSVVSATPYYYAVFAERYDVPSSVMSTKAATLVYADVGNIQQEIITDGIKVTWDAPSNVKNIEVWKNVGPVAPSRVGEGTKIDCTQNYFYDKGADGTNSYLIVCKYIVEGKEVTSTGIKTVYRPYQKTVPLKNVEYQRIGDNRYSMKCSPDYSGKISVYVSEKILPIQTDTVLKYIDFNSICRGMNLIESTVGAQGEILFSLDKGKVYQVYAVVNTEQLFVVSPPFLVNEIKGIECTHYVEKGTCYISGKTHPKVSSIVAVVSSEGYVEEMGDGHEKFVFAKEELLSQGKIGIKLKSNSTSYISLFGECKDGNTVSYSPVVKLEPPIECRNTVTVLYKMECNVSATKPFKITVSFEADEPITIPKMLIVQGSPRPPLDKNSGKLTERLPALTLKKGLFSKKYTGKHVITVSPAATSTKYRMFASDEMPEYLNLKQVLTL